MQQITHTPVDSSVYAVRELASAQQIAQALETSSAAASLWRNTSIAERAAICHRMVDAFVANKQSIAEEITWQMGRPISQAPGEVDGFAERARYMIDIAETALAPIQLPQKPGVVRYIEKAPRGLVLVVAPWNYPYLTAVNAFIPAIMAGNTVILKHSAQTPLCAERIYEAFAAAELPKGVFQYLHLQHSDVEQLLRSGNVDHLCFTGSVEGGRVVAAAAAEQFVSTGLELGGKDPAYVRADADLDHAVATLVDGAFFNAGQCCCGIERIYVHSDIHDEFIDRAVTLVNQYHLGNPLDPATTLGPMVRTAAADFVRGQIRDALDKGARAHIDPQTFPGNHENSPYMAPQLLSNVNHQMRVMTEESFGPVVGIQKVANDEEALALMNDSAFGLTAAIFTRDPAAAERLGRQVETGTLFANRCDYLDPALAWTGVKNSGLGCTLSSLGYDQLTRPKSFYLKSLTNQ